MTKTIAVPSMLKRPESNAWPLSRWQAGCVLANLGARQREMAEGPQRSAPCNRQQSEHDETAAGELGETRLLAEHEDRAGKAKDRDQGEEHASG